MPFDGERWNPSHKPNAGSRGRVPHLAGQAPRDPLNRRIFSVEGMKFAREGFQRRKLGVLVSGRGFKSALNFCPLICLS
jgi:hypothetical protein